MADVKNKRYVNAIALIAVVLFLLYLMWRNDAQYIVGLAWENLNFIESGVHDFVPKLFLLITLYIVFRLVSFVFIDLIVRKLHEYFHTNYDFRVTSSMLKFLLWGIFVITGLMVFFDDAGTIITSLGLVGFGITFALQKPILNFVGWLTISLKNIYSIGDRVKMGEVRGDVKTISMMNTELEGLLEHSDVKSGKIITVPNELVLTGDVENYTRDSNYLLNELAVSITYESDLAKAEKILRNIIERLTRENQKKLKKSMGRGKESIEETLLYLTEELLKAPRRRKREIKEEMQQLEEQKEKSLHAEELIEEFKPKVRVEMKDSAVELICQFFTPYDEIKANRTRIVKEFLLALEREKDVEVAYPHMELVFNKTAKKLKN